MATLRSMLLFVLTGVPVLPQGRLTPELARAAVARFEGTLRNFDKKQFVVELDDKQTLIFRRTKSTQIQPKDMELGVQVQVYARKDAAGDMEAVQVCQGKCSVKSR